MNKEEKSKIGKKSRASGKAFETRIKKDLENQAVIVARWTKNVEFEELPDDDGIPFKTGKIVDVKPKYNPFTKSLMMNSGGFPDFIVFSKASIRPLFGVECKTNGYLDKVEREKCKWLLEKKIFNLIIIAYKDGKKIKYKVFE